MHLRARSFDLNKWRIQLIKLNRLNREAAKDAISGLSDDDRAYNDIRKRVMKRLDDSRHATAERIEEATENAANSARSAAEFTTDQISRATERVRREMNGVGETATQKTDAVREKITPSRPKFRYLVIASAALGVGNFLLGRWSRSPRRAEIFKKGDKADAGLYSCRSCGTRLQMSSRGNIPECSNCKSREFARV